MLQERARKCILLWFLVYEIHKKIYELQLPNEPHRSTRLQQLLDDSMTGCDQCYTQSTTLSTF
jgi:hypothetical protein